VWPRRQSPRLLVAGGRRDEKRRLVSVLFCIHAHPHEHDTGSVRRDLRIADPRELEQIGFRDRALRLGGERTCDNRDDEERCGGQEP
jgi:hypothetical protein